MGGKADMAFENVVYPAFIRQEEESFGVHFPTLLPDYGWEVCLSSGSTKEEAIQNAKKALAYLLAGALYDNEDLPSQAPIPANLVTEEMELVFIKHLIVIMRRKLRIIYLDVIGISILKVMSKVNFEPLHIRIN